MTKIPSKFPTDRKLPHSVCTRCLPKPIRLEDKRKKDPGTFQPRRKDLARHGTQTKRRQKSQEDIVAKCQNKFLGRRNLR